MILLKYNMQQNTDALKIESESDFETYNKAQEILKETLVKSSLSCLNKNSLFNPYHSCSMTGTTFETIKKASKKFLKRGLLNIYYRKFSFKTLRNFSTSYRLWIYSYLFVCKTRFIENLRICSCSKRNKTIKIISSLKMNTEVIKRKFSLLNPTKIFIKKAVQRFKKEKQEKIVLKIYTASSYWPYQLSTALINLETNTYKLYGQSAVLTNLIRLCKQYFKNPKKPKLWDKFESNSIISVKAYFKTLLSRFYLGKKNLLELGKRSIIAISIYMLPFVFLATQALVPFNEEYEYFLVNPLSANIFNKIPLLTDFIKFFRPFTTNPNYVIWVPLVYYIVFTSSYKVLNIPYKVALNGTFGSIFLMINYSFSILQLIFLPVFETVYIIKDIFFTSYLLKLLRKNSCKEKDEAFKIFSNLVSRYDFEISKNYYDVILFLNHRIISHLALISLVALVYNSIYYILHNKNPQIILVTKTALAAIKNPQEEE